MQSLAPASRALSDLDAMLEALVGDGVVPGGAAAIAGADGVIWERAFGRRALEPQAEAATLDTLWDLASVTKPLVTAALCQQARAGGLMRFEDPITTLVPEMAPAAGEPRAPSIGELLVHAGGLPSWAPLYAQVEGGLPERARLLARRREEPGRRAVYGCPGYQVLGLALERLHGAPLAELAGRHVLAGLAGDAVFGSVPAELRARTAPTELGNAFERRLAGEDAVGYDGWRSGIIRGEVHDHNAFTLGGGAGNAGLFATAGAAARLCARYLRPDDVFSRRDLEELSTDLAPHLEPSGESRTWGFQLARSPGSPAGDAVDDRAFGHAGFTGTSVLVDPSRGAAYVLLTNRIHPRWTERPFHEDRRRFHAVAAAAAEALHG